jgi:hypothetical protein
LGIILRVLRMEVSVYNVHITNQFRTTFAGGGGGNPLVEVTVNSKEENSQDFLPNSSKFGLSRTFHESRRGRLHPSHPILDT